MSSQQSNATKTAGLSGRNVTPAQTGLPKLSRPAADHLFDGLGPVAQRREQAGFRSTKTPANDPGSNPGGPTIPPWPIGDFWVVSYSYGGDFVATRHRGGCGVLRNARMTQDEGSGGRYGMLSVIEEERYRANMARNPGLPEPEDHTCCKHSAPVASFRSVEASS